eukprot:CAMPEP_0172592262 /NCGR_PEP_ID=MMETSP1068-20121228/11177_1 /TAXON_ID=35684 /ORGANISM="Pseudopedinella elastica, Strain CCMP716" /LENGTH=447 /DNA_ID=CAMNT_0013389163 /DNA_START=128 /DNA_END=1471 /DNA_ORIENTATION=-
MAKRVGDKSILLLLQLFVPRAAGLAQSLRPASGGRMPPPPESFPPGSYDTRDFFRHEIIHESSKSGARVGRLHTPHGIVDTPGFVAVATNGALKCLDIASADEAGQQLVFCNSYHLMLQPGGDIIEEAGGLHKFMSRPIGPIITDSGGFQIFSLAYGSVHNDVGQLNAEPTSELKRAAMRKKAASKGSNVVKVTEEGVRFRSYRDGRYVDLTPESTVQAQKQYLSDIIIPLDELPPYSTTRERLEESVLLSHRWEERSLREHLKDFPENVKGQAMYAVVHGGVEKELRKLSVDYLTALPFDGFAIGGSLGSCHEELVDLLKFVVPKLPREKPNHLLGIADEKSILAAVPLGIDTFDSCFPTRLARHGTLLTKAGKLHVSNAKCARAFGKKICEGCSCATCTRYDLAYLHHLKKAKEPLLAQLATIHNIQYMNDMMADIRKQILADEI